MTRGPVLAVEVGLHSRYRPDRPSAPPKRLGRSGVMDMGPSRTWQALILPGPAVGTGASQIWLEKSRARCSTPRRPVCAGGLWSHPWTEHRLCARCKVRVVAMESSPCPRPFTAPDGAPSAAPACPRCCHLTYLATGGPTTPTSTDATSAQAPWVTTAIRRPPGCALSPTELTLNRALAHARAPGDRGVARLKRWRISPEAAAAGTG